MLTTTTNTLPASEPVTHEALLAMGFTGSIADYYMIHLDDEGFVSLIIAPLAGRYDSLYMTALEMGDDDQDLTATASDMAGVRAFYDRVKAEFVRQDAACATRLAAALPDGWVAPFAGESIADRATTAALENAGLGHLFTEYPAGTTPW